MLVPPENNSDINPNGLSTGESGAASGLQPVTTPSIGSQLPTVTNTPPVQESSANTPQSIHTPEPINKKGKRSIKKILFVVFAIVMFGGAVTGAYLIGKKNQKVVIQAPTPQPINLPPNAVAVTDCVPGRGKQYVLPKDIPLGPIYDVNNNKVIAVEYNFKAADLFVNASRLSDTLIPFFQGNYSVKYFTTTPGELEKGQNQADTPINVAIFVVSKEEAESIKCDTPKTDS